MYFKKPYEIDSCVWGGAGGRRYRRVSGMAHFFKPGSISIGTLFHPQIYESPKVFRPRDVHE